MKHLPYILVVEDSDEDFATVLDAAKRASMTHDIRRALSGEAGLAALRACPKTANSLPLLIILDLNTPGDDGREVLQTIKQDERFGSIPLVVVTTSSNPLDINFCYAKGANAYHIKPVHHALHLQVLAQIFSYWLRSVVLAPEQKYQPF